MQDYRVLFPHTASSRIYWNHAATSPLSTRVLASVNRHLENRSSGAIDTYWNDIQVINELRMYCAKAVTAESPDRIALFTSTTDALNAIIMSYPWKTGDVVLLADAEFPANRVPYSWLKHYGVECEFISTVDGQVTPELVENALHPRVKVLALSAVQFLSGFRADLEGIGEVCARKGIDFVVDAIQAVGVSPINVQTAKISALAAGAQKWQMSMHGTGFLYCQDEFQSKLRSNNVGWLSVENAWNFFDINQKLASTAQRFEGGSLNFPGIFSHHASLGLLLEIGIESIHQHVTALGGRLREIISEISELRIITPLEDHFRAGIISAELGNPERAQEILSEFTARRIDISVREGLHSTQVLRFSPHFYSTFDELQSIEQALNEIFTKK